MKTIMLQCCFEDFIDIIVGAERNPPAADCYAWPGRGGWVGLAAR